MINSEEKDVFDRLMMLPGLRVFSPFYRKYKEVLLYLFFGGLTFIVSMLTFVLFYQLVGINELIANILSWVIAVLFAYFTNRSWVFHAVTSGIDGLLKQAGAFFSGRVIT